MVGVILSHFHFLTTKRRCNHETKSTKVGFVITVMTYRQEH